MSTVKLPRPLVNELLHQAQLGADCEVCGLIGARDGAPLHCRCATAAFCHGSQSAN